MIKLKSNEFLSIYTGFVLGENFSVVTRGLEKLYDARKDEIPPYTAELLAKNFRNYINKNRPDLARAVKELGKFNLQDGVDTIVAKFEEIIGSNVVEISKLSNAEDLTF